jgi:succinate dehydrogenase / fumarate reductase, membrane anchor subunit
MANLGQKTPLGRVRGLGSAKSGTADFWRERVTGAALVPLTIAFVAILLGLAGSDYVSALALLASPLVAVLMLLFIGVSIVHMRLGMQVIIEDYVHDETTKIVCVIANTFISYFIGAIAIYALAKLNFGI